MSGTKGTTGPKNSKKNNPRKPRRGHQTTTRVALLWLESTPPHGAATLGPTAQPDPVTWASLVSAARFLGEQLTRGIWAGLCWLLTRLPPLSGATGRLGAKAYDAVNWRLLARSLARRGLTLGLAVVLAIVPGALLLAAAAMVWQRLQAAAPFAATVQQTRAPSAQLRHAPHPKTPGARAQPASGSLAATPAKKSSTPQPSAARPVPAGQAPIITPSAATTTGSCSAGSRSSGPLQRAAKLSESGEGYRLLFPHRNLIYGTDELVTGVQALGKRLGTQALPLQIGNLSGPSGDQAGQDPFHPAAYSRSHGAGRAADLAFPVIDALGRPAQTVETNLHFRSDGQSEAGIRRLYLPSSARAPAGCRRSRFASGLAEVVCLLPEGAFRLDYDRGWQLVRATLLSDAFGVIDRQSGVARADGSGLRFIFVAPFIEEGLLAAAARAGEPQGLQQIAALLLHQPSNAGLFDRMLHLELWCTAEDRVGCGCSDGTRPWKRWRTGAQVVPAQVPTATSSGPGTGKAGKASVHPSKRSVPSAARKDGAGGRVELRPVQQGVHPG